MARSAALLLLVGDGAAASATPLRVQDLQTFDTPKLATALIGGPAATRFVTHEVEPPFFPNAAPPGVWFLTAGRAAGAHLCRKDAMLVTFAASMTHDPDALLLMPLTVSQILPSVRIAWSTRCDAPEQPYAAVNYADFDGAARMLTAFARWQSPAGRQGLRHTRVTCRFDYEAAVCAGAPTDALARVRLDRIGVISKLNGGDAMWELSTRLDTGPIWMVAIAGDSDHPEAIDLHYGAPPPF